MRRLAFSTQIDAPVDRVWRALCDPTEVAQWDSGVVGAIDAPADYPRPGQTVRWQYGSERWPELLDRPQEVVPEQKLRSILELGPYYMDETYSLTAWEGGTMLTTTVELTIKRSLIGTL